MTTLSQVTQIIWPSLQCANGYSVGLRMSRTDPRFPNYRRYDCGAANKIYLDQTHSPRLVSDLELNQAYQTTNGKSALDAISLQFIDVTSYSGTLNGSPINESVVGSTFFTEWFNDTANVATKNYPLRLWIDWFNPDGTLNEKSFVFSVDPNYKPQEQNIIFAQNGRFAFPGVDPIARAEAMLEGTLRTIQAIAINISGTWQSVLNLVTQSDCELGAGYMGYMWQPPNTSLAGGFQNGTAVFTSGTSGNFLMQATPYYHHVPFPYPGGAGVRNAVVPYPPTRTFGQMWPVTNVAWDMNSTQWFGPSGTWWISLGTLFSKIAASPGQTFATDGAMTLGSAVLTSASAQFSSGMVGKAIEISVDNIAVSTTVTGYISLTQITTGHTATVGGTNCFWRIAGDTSQQILFDVNAQLGAGSPIATQCLQILKQLPDATHYCYPVDTATGQIIPKDIYISVNAFLGSHPRDGSQWLNPVAFNPTSNTSDCLQSLCNFLLCEYNIVTDQTAGQPRLVLDPIGAQSGAMPVDWIPAGQKFSEQEPSTGTTAVSVNNTGIGPTIMCPLSANTSNVAGYSVPIQLRTWGSALHQSIDPLFLGARTPILGGVTGQGTTTEYMPGVTVVAGGLIFDPAKDANSQAEECFAVVWFDGSNNPTLNANCWKGLCYAMYKDTSNSNTMYPTGNGFNTPLQCDTNDGGWNGNLLATAAFYALGCQYGPGATPNANEPNSDRFNSIDFQAVVLGTFQIQTGMQLQRDYFGIADDGTNGAAGSLSKIDVGITGTWTYDISSTNRANGVTTRSFRVLEMTRLLYEGTTRGVKWQEIISASYPDITSLLYGMLPGSSGGSNSSAASGGLSGAGSGGNPATNFVVATDTISADTDNYASPVCDLLLLTVAANCALKGMVAGTAWQLRTIKNAGPDVLVVYNNASATAANNFSNPHTPNGEGGNLPIMPKGSASYRYNPIDTAWELENFSASH